MYRTETTRRPEVSSFSRLLCGKAIRSVVLVMIVGLAACSPDHNWRTWRANTASLVGVVPCKPDVAQREMMVDQARVSLHMQSCDNQGLRFALAWATLPAGADPQVFMMQWQKASAHALKAQQPAQALNKPNVRGALHTAWWAMQGQDHRGQMIRSEVVFFSDAQHVYQAAIYGQTVTDEAVAPFWEGLKLP